MVPHDLVKSRRGSVRGPALQSYCSLHLTDSVAAVHARASPNTLEKDRGERIRRSISSSRWVKASVLPCSAPPRRRSRRKGAPGAQSEASTPGREAPNLAGGNNPLLDEALVVLAIFDRGGGLGAIKRLLA